MLRVLEPELMEDATQVAAYAEADFAQPHNDFIQRLQTVVANPGFNGNVLDLGCGPGDVTRRFAKAFPFCKIDAVDGSKPMLDYAINAEPDLQQRINYVLGLLPDVQLPKQHYGIIYSNSLLHHLPNPQILWQVVKQYAASGTYIIIMDLLRPETPYMAKALIKEYAKNEPEILQRDFYNSLLAAFTLTEIQDQLDQAGLSLTIEQTSDRHVFIYGCV
jgi:trans-aconitate methyltransferase